MHLTLENTPRGFWDLQECLLCFKLVAGVFSHVHSRWVGQNSSFLNRYLNLRMTDGCIGLPYRVVHSVYTCFCLSIVLKLLWSLHVALDTGVVFVVSVFWIIDGCRPH